MHLPSRRVVAAALLLAGAAAVCRDRWELIRVEGPSMEPTLRSGELWLAQSGVPARVGDVVAIDMSELFPAGTQWVKRVVLVNDEPRLVIDEYDGEEAFLPPHSVFAVGDNAAHSRDSRHVGAVPSDRVRCRLVRRVR